MRKSFEALLVAILFFGALCQGEFDYENQDQWGGKCADGERQSPINIASRDIEYCPDWGYEKITFSCKQFEEDVTGDDYGMQNIGDAFIFYYDQGQNLYEAYRSSSIHWYTSSEHSINGEFYDAELELRFSAAEWTELSDEALGDHANTDFSNASNQYTTKGASMRFLFYEDENAEEDIFSGLRMEEGKTYWNLYTMLGCVLDRYFYIYRGSATTPMEGQECE